jgi:CBS domain-containing protein
VKELDMGTKMPSVTDVMTVGMMVVGVDATVEEADAVLRTAFTTGVPVVDDSGALVGVVTHADVAAYRFARQKPDPNVRGRSPGRPGERLQPGRDPDDSLAG